MIADKKIIVVLPAYNAGATLRQTYAEIPHELVDEILLVDDASSDDTIKVAESLGIKHIITHDSNKGYGGNQKTCYNKALSIGADVIIMLHPDYQYTPKLIPAMVNILTSGVYPVVLGSRILGNGALKGGMPVYKYLANRLLTFFQNILIGQKLSEFHTGYRAYTADVLKGINYNLNSDDYIFDNEILSQIFMKGYEIAEITCPAKYFREASTINFSRSIKYGFGIIRVSIQHRLHMWGIIKGKIY